MHDPFSVLIVDDDQNMTRTLADILAASGYAAETATRAEEGLEKLQARRFDSVVSDIRLHGMNGVEFQKKIKEQYGDIPVLLITGYAEHDLIVEARKQGVLAFLEKPLDITQLLSLLRVLASGINKKKKPGRNHESKP
jgi:DNA-binding NtrC family response regulator